MPGSCPEQPTVALGASSAQAPSAHTAPCAPATRAPSATRTHASAALDPTDAPCDRDARCAASAM
eukprot:3941812-Rhodomonas_salina.8